MFGMAFRTSKILATSLASAGALSRLSSVSECSEIKNPNQMAYRMLGNTGLQVSVLSYGFWATFGAKPDLQNDAGIQEAVDCLRVARDGGINLFDNAEVYGVPYGEAERIMGLAIETLQREDPIKWRRSDIIITTKLFWGGEGVNEKGLSRKHVIEGIDASLQRLKTPYVDLVFCHRPDPLTPTETVVRAMTDVVRSGKAHSWGTSEWSAQQFTEAVWIAKLYGLEPPQFEQPQYNMFHRERFEKEYAPLYAHPYNMGTTIWSPLASGLLTGKYNDEIPEGSRLTAPNYGWLKTTLDTWRKEGKIDKVRALDQFAKERFGFDAPPVIDSDAKTHLKDALLHTHSAETRHCSLGHLALAWCIKNKAVSTVLLGATKPHQLRENLGAMRIARELTEEDMKTIEGILANKPEPYQGFGGTGMRKIDPTI